MIRFAIGVDCLAVRYCQKAAALANLNGNMAARLQVDVLSAGCRPGQHDRVKRKCAKALKRPRWRNVLAADDQHGW